MCRIRIRKINSFNENNIMQFFIIVRQHFMGILATLELLQEIFRSLSLKIRFNEKKRTEMKLLNKLISI